MKTRSETEIFKLLLTTAQDDPNIRAVILEGSRAIDASQRDPFQDYDIIFAVTAIDSYKNNCDWIRRFGDLMILQMPDGMGESSALDHKFTYLMQFLDGSRIDLNCYSLEHLERHSFTEPYKVLLDKDYLFASLSVVGEEAYYPKKPSEKDFADSCNEFWWVVPYVAKGLWREHLEYARYMLESVLHSEMMKMLNWYFGIKTNFNESPGKLGKKFHKHIEREFLTKLNLTYENANISQTWVALDNMCDLFRNIGNCVATHFCYSYPQSEDKNISVFLQHVRNMPKDAETIY